MWGPTRFPVVFLQPLGHLSSQVAEHENGERRIRRLRSLRVDTLTCVDTSCGHPAIAGFPALVVGSPVARWSRRSHARVACMVGLAAPFESSSDRYVQRDHGERRIRTSEGLAALTAFEAVAFDHSAISPRKEWWSSCPLNQGACQNTRREEDSNPRGPFRDLTAFKAVAFNRSAIPPKKSTCVSASHRDTCCTKDWLCTLILMVPRCSGCRRFDCLAVTLTRSNCVSGTRRMVDQCLSSVRAFWSRCKYKRTRILPSRTRQTCRRKRSHRRSAFSSALVNARVLSRPPRLSR